LGDGNVGEKEIKIFKIGFSEDLMAKVQGGFRQFTRNKQNSLLQGSRISKLSNTFQNYLGQSNVKSESSIKKS